jgi:hypothetical protein
MSHHHASSGRVSVTTAAEDDLHNRFVILHRTMGKSRWRAFGLVLTYFVLETTSNILGCLRRWEWNSFAERFVGRCKALCAVTLLSTKVRKTPI